MFGVELPNRELEQAATVGGLYRAICKEMKLEPVVAAVGTIGRVRHAGGSLKLSTVVWTPEDVWATMVWVVADQLQVDVGEVRYDARWLEDLGAD